MPKFFFFPESWNHLRQELVTHWRPGINGKHPHNYICEVNWDDPRCGWALAFDADMFVEYMNTKLKGVLKITAVTRDDELRIGHICGVFLKELRRIRGEPNP